MRALKPLREALLAASSSDEANRWDRGRGYDTLDARVLKADRILQISSSVAREEAGTVKWLFRSVGGALEARARGETREAVLVLLETATSLGNEERHYEAAAILEVALRGLSSVGDAALEADLCRRLGRASWRIGRLDRAVDLYRRAREIFFQLGDRKSEIVVLQGLGNVKANQGCWREAERCYRHALDRCEPGDAHLKGQLFNNLSQVSRRRGELEEAREWQKMAEEVWGGVDAPAERLISLNNRGLLHLEEGELDGARSTLLDGLKIAAHDLQRAALLTNLGHVALRAGRFEEAEQLAREAEEFAILAGAVDILIEAYTVLGCARARQGEPNCVALFEKALDLARDGRYPIARAKAHLEYGRFRRSLGDEEEAVAHFRTALSIYESTGEVRERAEVLRELERPAARRSLDTRMDRDLRSGHGA